MCLRVYPVRPGANPCGRVSIDPQRPESLMYWHRPDGDPVLIAVVFRVPSAEPNPVLGGPQWHAHRGRNGIGRWKMTHLWLLDGLRDGFAMEMPTRELNRLYGIPADGSGTGAGV